MPRTTLQNLTLEELWELFPISLSPHNPLWPRWAEEEICLLARLLAPVSPGMHHIGSTAIPTIQAKPIVDILVEVANGVEWSSVVSLMEAAGYICMARSPLRISFNKGYTPAGYAEKVFHIHFHRTGDTPEILFRDYLLSHPEAARHYEQLKLSLLPKYKNDRDAYTAAKAPFVDRILALASKSR